MEKLNTLNSKEKLKLKKKIENLFSSGRWLRSEHIRMVYLVEDPGIDVPCQALFTASKKNHRRAVKRNLLKRRMRESYRLQKNTFYKHIEGLDGLLVIGFIYSSDKVLDYKTINREVKKLLAQVSSRLSKNTR